MHGNGMLCFTWSVNTTVPLIKLELSSSFCFELQVLPSLYHLVYQRPFTFCPSFCYSLSNQLSRQSTQMSTKPGSSFFFWKSFFHSIPHLQQMALDSCSRLCRCLSHTFFLQQRDIHSKMHTHSLMHWLHINPKSHFLIFRHFLAFWGRILISFVQSFGRYFVKKILELLLSSFFQQKICPCQTFNMFWKVEKSDIWDFRSTRSFFTFLNEIPRWDPT